MEVNRFYLFLKIFVAFIVILIVEYPFCGIYFRFVRHIDFFRVDLICVLSAIGLCYLIFRKLIKAALKERIPFLVVIVCFLALCFLLSCFFRFSIQLANGLLDFSDPETRVVYVSDKKISSFGGSFKEGPNPMAHLIYFHDWDNTDEICELLTPPSIYYFTNIGTPVEMTLRQGFFYLPWVEDFRILMKGG